MPTFIVKGKKNKRHIVRLDEDDLRQRAATKIQCLVRRVQSHHIVCRRLDILYASLLIRCAIAIQCAWRRFKAKRIFRKKARKRRKVMLRKIIIVQSVFRRFLVLNRLAKKSKMNAGLRIAVCIQSHCRRKRAVAICNSLREEKRQAQLQRELEHSFIILQSHFRRKKAKKACTLLFCAKKAIIVQSFFRMVRAKYQAQQKFLIRVVIRIQSIFRMKIARRKTALIMQMKSLNARVTTVQSLFRRRRVQNLVKMMIIQKIVTASSITIQRVARGHFARNAVKIMQRIKIINKSVIMLQCAGRMVLARKALRRLKRIERFRIFRRFTAGLQEKCRKETLVSLKRYIHSVLCIQKVARRYLAIQQTWFMRLELKLISFQTLFRRYLARRKLSELRFLKKIVTIQSLWRRRLAVREVIRQRYIRKIVLCQSLYRARAARKRVRYIRYIREITICQSCCRRWHARKVLMQLKRIAKITIAQACVRRYLAIKYRKHLIYVNFVITYQKYARRYIARNRVKQYRLSLLATKIQCLFRKFSARKLLVRLRRVKMAIRIQSYQRMRKARKGYIIMRNQYRVFKFEEKCAIMIQCAFRCKLARRRLRQLKYLWMKKIKADMLQERVNNGIIWHLKRVGNKTKEGRLKAKLFQKKLAMEKVSGVPKRPNDTLPGVKETRAASDKIVRKHMLDLSNHLIVKRKIKLEKEKSPVQRVKEPISLDDNPDPVFTELPASQRKGETTSIGEVVESALKRIDDLLKGTSTTSSVLPSYMNSGSYGHREVDSQPYLSILPAARLQESLVWQPHMDAPVKYTYNSVGNLIEANPPEKSPSPHKSYEWAKSGGVSAPSTSLFALEQKTPCKPQDQLIRNPKSKAWGHRRLVSRPMSPSAIASREALAIAQYVNKQRMIKAQKEEERRQKEADDRAESEKIQEKNTAHRAERALKIKLQKIRTQKRAADNALRIERARRRALEKKLTDSASVPSADGDSLGSLSSDESLIAQTETPVQKKKVTFASETGPNKIDGYDSDGWSEDDVSEDDGGFGAADVERIKNPVGGNVSLVSVKEKRLSQEIREEEFARKVSAAMRRPSEARPKEKFDVRTTERYMDGNEKERFEIKLKTDLALLRIQKILEKPAEQVPLTNLRQHIANSTSGNGGTLGSNLGLFPISE